MPQDTLTLIQYAVLPIGLLTGGVLFNRGCFKATALANRPIRHTNLAGIDLVIGLMLVLFGMMLASSLTLLKIIDKNNPQHQAILMLAGQLCMFSPIVIYTIAKLRFMERSLDDLGLSLREPTHWKTGAWATVLGIPMLFSLNIIMAIISSLIGLQTPEIAHELLQTIHQTKSVSTLLILLTSAIIAAPVLEEFVFRGFLLQTLRDVISDQTPWVNIIVSSVIFAGIHISVTQWQTLPALFVLGGMLGWMYEKTGSLWPCIILHACFNALNVGIVLLVM